MLDERVKQKLLQQLKLLNDEGKLLPRSQLEQYFTTFRNRFGPERLASLDGEELLTEMHAHGNRESLAYWLEFKSDDEFPTIHFGGIGGGSAFKFGIFRRKETGNWVTKGEGKSGKELSVQEAVAVARKHRDQFLCGVEALRRLPPKGTDEDYRKLQEELHREAPNVSDLAWGHKYFYLIVPEKLDDFHSPDWQRFYLLKMLQLPPQGNGRYICASRFVEAANELGVPIDNLTYTLGSLHGPLRRCWRIGTSDSTAPRNRWSLMREENCIAIGYDALGDLSALEPGKDGREKLQRLLVDRYPGDPAALGRTRTQVFNFAKEIAEGDLVLASDGGTVLGVGRVVGEYKHEPSSDFPHRRTVEWLSLEEWNLPEPEGLRTARGEPSPDYSPGPRQGGAHCVAELVRVLAVTFGGGQTSHEVCYGRVNNPG